MTKLNGPSMIEPAELIWIKSGKSVPAEIFGRKAASLSQSGRLQRRIPNGFALSKSFVRGIAIGTPSSRDLSLLESAFEHLQLADAETPLIVRSSSSMEHVKGNSFSGLFQSVADVKSFRHLIEAIKSCYSSAYSKSVHDYCTMRHIELPSEHLAILIQKQVTRQSLVLIEVGSDNSLIEIFDGNSWESIKGYGAPACAVQVHRGRTKLLAGTGASLQEHEALISEAVVVADEVRSTLKEGGSALIEAAFNADKLQVLQINVLLRGEIPLATSSLISCLKLSPAEQVSTGGIKAAGMRYFYAKGLFEKKMSVSYPATDMETI